MSITSLLSTIDYDVAVIQLVQALTLSPGVSPVCLPGPGVTSDNVPALVTGWGTLASGGDQPRVLQVFSIKYLLYGIWCLVDIWFLVYFVFVFVLAYLQMQPPSRFIV